ALARHNGHQGLAAEELGISRRTLSRQLKLMREQGEESPDSLGQLSHRQQHYFRSIVEVPVQVRTPDGAEFTAQSSNLSIGGIALAAFPAEGQQSGNVQLRFLLPGAQMEITTQAMVAWHTRDGRAGLQFAEMEERDATELKRWILQRQFEEGWTALK